MQQKLAFKRACLLTQWLAWQQWVARALFFPPTSHLSQSSFVVLAAAADSGAGKTQPSESAIQSCVGTLLDRTVGGRSFALKKTRFYFPANRLLHFCASPSHFPYWTIVQSCFITSYVYLVFASSLFVFALHVLIVTSFPCWEWCPVIESSNQPIKTHWRNCANIMILIAITANQRRLYDEGRR